MGLYDSLPDHIDEVDVIVAGGGTAGCIVASRLSDAEPGLSVLVVESGINAQGDPTVEHPLFCLSHLAPGSRTVRQYRTKKAASTANREIYIQTANILGGGSSINMLQYTRGQRSDFDDWNMPGWDADSLIPYMKKIESYAGAGSKETHGFDGPLCVSEGPFRVPRARDAFIRAMDECGYPEAPDMQCLDGINGTQKAVAYMTPSGKRQGSSSCYLFPRLEGGKHPNLHVLVQSPVERVLFQGKKAVGIEYRPHGGTVPRSVMARKMVVVSSGAFGTPQVLERSGIGASDTLTRAGVPLVEKLPDVGEHLQDHHLLILPYKCSLKPEETADSLATGQMNVEKMLRDHDKMLGWNLQDVTCKLRPSDDDVQALGPEFQKAWDKFYKTKPDKPVALAALVGCYPSADPSIVPPNQQHFGISTFSVYPFSRGHVHITGPSLDDEVDVEAGYFADEHGIDVLKCRWVYKVQREAARRMDIFRGEIPLGHPPFAADSKAALVDLDKPHPADFKKTIEYTAEDDAVIDKFVRENTGTTWHNLGTCRMAPRDKGGVVDEHLSVYGVENLKLADLSIVPGNVAANTCNTAYIVGEKAASIIIEELRLGV